MAPSPEHSSSPPWEATHPKFRIAGLGAGSIIAILVAIIVVLGIITWIIYTQLRARRLGLPAPGFRSYIPFMKSNPRSAPASYEPSRGASNPGVFGKLFGSKNGYSGANARSARTRAMGDEVWSTRIGDDEETELGLNRRDSYTGYGYGHYGEPARDGAREGGLREVPREEEETRGRSRSRDGRAMATPFERDVAGLRAVEEVRGRPSGESERRSAFRESIT
ncbi:hypothetical protein RUND412_007886 [Rhizina undulata]